MKVPAALGDFDGNSADLPVGRFYPAGVRTYIAHEARGAYAFRVLVADTVLYVFLIWLGATLFKADIPFLYTADCRYIVAAGLVTLSVMYHIIVRPGAIRTHRLNDISYEHFSFYNYIFHYFIPMLMTADYLFFVDKTELHWHIMISWMIYPALYVVFVYWRAWMTIVTHGTSHLYPYTFMDPRMNDVFSITKGCLKVGFQFFLIGICVYAAGKGLYLLDIPPAAWTYNG